MSRALRQPTVLAATTRALLDSAAAASLDRESLIRRAGVPESALEDPRGRVPRDAHVALWADIERALGDPAVGLRFAAALKPDAFGTLGFLAMASGTVGDALGRIADYHRLVKGGETRLVSVGGGMLLEEVRTPTAPPWPRALVDYALATYVVLFRQWTQRPVSPSVVLLPYAAPRDPSTHEQAFGCAVRFGQPIVGLVFEGATLSTPLVTRQPTLADLLRSVAEESMRSLGAEEALVGPLRLAIAERLADGDVLLERVARSLGTSPRTLQRHLRAVGLSFHEIVDDVRRSEAMPLVLASRTPLEAIAERVGYAEAAAFRRAFRRWTGQSPREVRRGRRGEERE